MATAGFKSTTRGTAVGGADGSGSSSGAGVHRRSRSLSRWPGHFPVAPPAGDDEPAAPPRGRFVNTVRGSGFPEISLDDLADEFFTARGFEEELERGMGRSGRRLSDASFLMETESSRRRGRSVSRKGSGGETNLSSGGSFDGNARRRRSVSVARNRCTDSESESSLSCNSSTQSKLKNLPKGNHVLPASHEPSNSTHTLRRSHSQKDLRQSQDSHSRHSSTLTDDGLQNAHTNKSGPEKTIVTVCDRKKTEHPVGDGDEDGLYEAMRKEVRHAVEEIRVELEKAIVKTKPAMGNDGKDFQSKRSEVVQSILEIRRNYTTKLEESEKRKQELLAELAAEEQRGRELTKIVKELLPGTKQTIPEKPSRFRRRSDDRTRMSKHLSKEAARYFDDFISSVEDTDISSFDGERSDGSSTMGGSTKSSAVAETQACLAKTASSPAEIDGLVLPWLKWETCNDNTLVSCKSKRIFQCSLEMMGCHAVDTRKDTEEASGMRYGIYSESSRGSWSPGDNDSYSVISKNKTSSNIGEAGCCINSDTKSRSRLASFNMDEYMHLQHTEDFFFEGLRQRQRIESGCWQTHKHMGITPKFLKFERCIQSRCHLRNL